MIKTIFLSLFLIFSFNTVNVRAADSGPPPEVIKKTNPTYSEAKTLVKSKKFDNAIGLNYIDVYHRSGTYPLPLPNGIGLEAAGVIEERAINGGT